VDDLGLILVSAALVNNFVLVQFLGLCPFLGVSDRYPPATALGLATACVLTLSAALAHTVERWVLAPLELEFLRLIVFITLIAAVVQFTERVIRATGPLLHAILGIYLPLITSNCAVLGVAILAVGQALSFFATLVYSVGAALGFAVVISLFAALRERLSRAAIPEAFAGIPIALVSAGILALGFMGFAGMGR
jgi:electron transport complex protein RnfA